MKKRNTHPSHDLAYMVAVNMEGVECEEDKMQVVHSVECVQQAHSDIRQRCQPHCNPCQERHDARNLGNPCVFPLSQLQNPILDSLKSCAEAHFLRFLEILDSSFFDAY